MSEDQSAHLQNPAGRVYLFLKYTREEGAENTRLAHAWGPYFGLTEEVVGFPRDAAQETDGAGVSTSLLSGLTRLLEGCDQINLLLSQIQGSVFPVGFFDAEVNAARSILQRGIQEVGSNYLEHFRKSVDGGVLKALQTCSHVLANAQFEQTMTSEDAAEKLIAAAQELYTTIASESSLSARYRALLLGHLADVLDSLQLYRASGLDAALRDFDSLLRTVQRDPQMASNLVSKPNIRSGFDKFGKVLAGFLLVIHAPVAIAGDVDAMSKSLTLPSAPTSIVAGAN